MGIVVIRKMWKTAVMEAVGPLDSGVAMMVCAHLVRLLRMIVLLALWRMVLTEGDASTGMTVDIVLTYTLVASAFEDQFEIRTMLEGALWRGHMARHFACPMGMFLQFAARTIGTWFSPFVLYTIPVLLAAPLLGVHVLPGDLGNVLWFVPSLVLGISAGFAIDFVFVTMAVAWAKNIWVFVQIRDAVTMLLSGALIPLTLYPWGVGNVFGWLPFAAVASAPLRIYTGTGDVGTLLAMQVAWNLALWPLAHGLWKFNRERIVSYGG